MISLYLRVSGTTPPFAPDWCTCRFPLQLFYFRHLRADWSAATGVVRPADHHRGGERHADEYCGCRLGSGLCGTSDTAASSAVTASAGNDLGSALGYLGRPTIGIALAAIRSAVNRNVHSTFQVDQQRLIEAASWVASSSRMAPSPCLVGIVNPTE